LRRNTFADDRNPRKFGLIFTIDNPKEKITVDGVNMERWENPEVWPEANPLVAELDNLAEKLMEDYKTKKEIPKDFFLFKVKNLNLWMGANEGDGNFFVDQHTLQKSRFEPAGNWEWWRGKQQVIIGLDLSLRIDNTAVTFMWYDTADGHHYVKNLVFYPKDMEAYKSQAEHIPYATWARHGYCQGIGEDVIDYNELADIIINICQDYDIGIASVAYDTKYSRSLIDRLIEGLPMEVDHVKIEQNSRHLGDVISTLQGIVYDGSFHYAPNPLMESAFINGEIEFRQGKPYIRKGNKHRNKIDNLFSSFNAMKVSMYMEQNNLYETERAFFFEL
jgi:phage terminase large subunit-like protein